MSRARPRTSMSRLVSGPHERLGLVGGERPAAGRGQRRPARRAPPGRRAASPGIHTTSPVAPSATTATPSRSERPSAPAQAAASASGGASPASPASTGDGLAASASGSTSASSTSAAGRRRDPGRCRTPRRGGRRACGTRGSRRASDLVDVERARSQLDVADRASSGTSRTSTISSRFCRTLASLAQVLAQLRRLLVEVLEDAVEAAVGGDQLGRRLLPHPGHAGQVVGRVATQRGVLRVQRGR